MGHTLLSLFLFICLTICVLPTASSPTYQVIFKTNAVHMLDSSSFSWGKDSLSSLHGARVSRTAARKLAISYEVSGKYRLDLEVYHREVKPIFLASFREAYTARTFNGMYVLAFKTQLTWSHGILKGAVLIRTSILTRTVSSFPARSVVKRGARGYIYSPPFKLANGDISGNVGEV